MLVTTLIVSLDCRGVIPRVLASVQDCPSWLVQMALSPNAIQPRWPPAILTASCPSGGWPPPGSWTGASRQVCPASVDTKNCWRTALPVFCEPVVTIVLPEATMRSIRWKTPRASWPG